MKGTVFAVPFFVSEIYEVKGRCFQHSILNICLLKHLRKPLRRQPQKLLQKPPAKKPARRKKAVALSLPAVPLRGLVAFPNMVLPLFIGREKSIAALQEAQDAGRPVLLVAQRDEDNEEPAADDLFTFGVLADVMQLLKMPDGNVRAVLEAKTRGRVLSLTQKKTRISRRKSKKSRRRRPIRLPI